VFDSRNRASGPRPTSRSRSGRVESMFGKAQRYGIRGHIRGWFSFVPTDDYAYCALSTAASPPRVGDRCRRVR
jgi:hypothetical protein